MQRLKLRGLAAAFGASAEGQNKIKILHKLEFDHYIFVWIHIQLNSDLWF